MPLLEDGQLVTDTWQDIDDRQAIADGSVIVTLARFLADRATLLSRVGGLGVRLRNTDALDGLLQDLSRLDLIVLEFPKFTDGRAYSQARLLRECHGYRGRLRATGQVLIDQYLLMRRCGFDSFEITRPLAPDAWQRAATRFSAFYQPAGDGREQITALRRKLHHRATKAGTPTVAMHPLGAIPCSDDGIVAASFPHDVRRPALPDGAAICTIDAK